MRRSAVGALKCRVRLEFEANLAPPIGAGAISATGEHYESGRHQGWSHPHGAGGQPRGRREGDAPSGQAHRLEPDADGPLVEGQGR